DCFQTRAARLVDCGCGYRFGYTGAKSNLTSDVWTTTSLTCAIPDGISDLIRRNAGEAQAFCRYRNARIGGRPRSKRRPKFPDRSAEGDSEKNVLHIDQKCSTR